MREQYLNSNFITMLYNVTAAIASQSFRFYGCTSSLQDPHLRKRLLHKVSGHLAKHTTQIKDADECVCTSVVQETLHRIDLKKSNKGKYTN